MEAEIIRWTCNLYNGDRDSCGIVTSGGTESIVLSMLAYREKARVERGVIKPNIVMSNTAHADLIKEDFILELKSERYQSLKIIYLISQE